MDNTVTWLIVVKNGMPYFPETLASIEAQTYKDWEVLVWDNGSTDETLEELKKWIPSRLPGRVIADKPTNVGRSRAELVSLCKTELCAIIDADDINLPQRLEIQVAFLASHPEVAVVGSQMYCIDTEGEAISSLYSVPIEHDDIVHTMLYQNSMGQPSVLFRKSAILEVGNYQHKVEWNGVNIEDYDLWLRVAAANYKLANLNLPLVKYRIHSQSTTQQAIRENRLQNAVNICLIENTPKLFGCSRDEIKLLKERSHPLAIKPLYKIAKYLHITQKGSLIDRLRSNSFINASKNLVSPSDIVSYLALVALSQQKSVFRKRLSRTLKSTIIKLPSVQFQSQFIREYIWQKRMRQWLKQHQEDKSNIHLSIEVTGVRSPFDLVKIHTGCTIDRDVTLWLSPDEGSNPKLEIKSKAYIGRNTFIGTFQPITIGEYTQIGAYSYIISGNHRYERRDIPIMQQGFVGASIVIEDDVWLGTHVVVLPGVTIGKGAIVGAGSVVTKNIPPYEIWAGTPAKFIKHRPTN